MSATAVETSTGRYVDLLAPDPATICLADIAAHLSCIGRYNGACRRYLSVAEHAILVADRLRSRGHGPRTILLGLHQVPLLIVDYGGNPAVIGAVGMLAGEESGAAEEIDERLNIAIAAALSLPDWTTEDWGAVKAADDWALAAEAYHLLPSQGCGWVTEGLFDPEDPRNPPREAGLLPGSQLTPAVAEGLFIGQHQRWAALLADITGAAA